MGQVESHVAMYVRLIQPFVWLKTFLQVKLLKQHQVCQVQAQGTMLHPRGIAAECICSCLRMNICNRL